MRALVVFVVAALVLISVAGAIFWYVVASGPQPLATAEPLFEARNLGLAELENGRFAEAIPYWQTVADEQPGDPLGPQNLTVAGLSLMEVSDPRADADAFAAGRTAAAAGLDGLTRLDVDRALRLRLQGEFDTLLGNAAEAAGAFSEAAHDAADDPDLWYEAYVSARDVDDPTAASFLANARQLNPSNLFLIAESLPTADPASDRFGELLDWAEQTLAPLQAEIAGQSGIDVLARLEAIRDDPAASLPLRREVANIIRPQPLTQSDRLDIDRNLLEFVRTDFGKPFYDTFREAGPPEMTAASFPYELAGGGSIGLRIPPRTGSSKTGGLAPDLSVHLKAASDLVRPVPIDFDLDGRPELLTTDQSGAPMVVSFGGVTLATAPPGPGIPLDVELHLVAVDLDNDFDAARAVNDEAGFSPCRTADLDVLCWGADRLVILRNELADDGTRSLVPIDSPIDSPIDAAAAPIEQVAVLDVEADGDLDLAIVRGSELQVYANDGDAGFSRSTRPIVQPKGRFTAKSLVPVDLDGDFDIDLVAATDRVLPLGWFENVRRGILRWRTITDVSLGPGAEADSLTVLEGTGDGVWDIAVIAGSDSLFVPGRSSQPGRWSAEPARKLGHFEGRAIAVDLDRDGWVELLGMGRLPVDPETGVGMKGFRGPVVRNRFLDRRASVQSVFADRETANASQALLGNVDWRDGRSWNRVDPIGVVDLVGDDEPQLLLKRNSDLRLLSAKPDAIGSAVFATLLAEQVKDDNGQPSGRVNSYGVGTTLQLLAGEQTITRRVTGPTTTLGLGGKPDADSLRVLWTNGIPAHVIGPEAGQYVCEEQKLKGSCPYAYGWDGERFVFLTDLLWAAPIGLTDAGGQLMQPREWEHLTIRGDRLRPRDGRYELRITEELWEAAYFDRVRLLAVDHRPEVAIVTNEKVGPPTVAEPMLHRIADPIAPSRATIDGRDVTATLAERDDDYARGYTTKRLQGLVDTAHLDLTFPRVPEGPVTLLLEGWLRPTDTSLNVAIAQNRRLAPPQPPSISVPDGDGWRVVRPFVGFPGGKTKPIAIDLGDLLDRSDPRLRITSSQELAYDAVAIAARNTLPMTGDDTVRVTECPIRAAVLRTRGVSGIAGHPNHGPERFDYADVSPSPWRPMRGRFTRLGDVADLLAKEDDRIVVIGSGDEIAVSCEAPPLDDGWTRDFVLSSWGWDKDADLNTVLGDSSEPFPEQGRRYPVYTPVEDRDDATFHTRRFRE